MLRTVCRKVVKNMLPGGTNVRQNLKIPVFSTQKMNMSVIPQDHDETDAEFDDRMVCYFSRCDIDGWELRKGLNDLAGMDLVPEPRVLAAALRACRRVNDFAMTVRLLEMVKCKCGPHAPVIYPWILKELQPVMKELGVNTPEELGYAVPELYMQSVYEM